MQGWFVRYPALSPLGLLLSVTPLELVIFLAIALCILSFLAFAASLFVLSALPVSMSAFLALAFSALNALILFCSSLWPG